MTRIDENLLINKAGEGVRVKNLIKLNAQIQCYASVFDTKIPEQP